jgi:IMP cyclohydrolase
MKENLYEYLAGNVYPGRGICVGLTQGGNKVVIAYFIMGRSTNSRNRVFDPTPGGIRTIAADPSKMTDPHLIIYNPVRTYNNTTIVTNGDQTDTIYDFMAHDEFPGFNFEAALQTRTFEDDKPNWTPRISGLVDMQTGSYKLNILKSCEGSEKSVQRFTFDYPQPLAGVGHFISTYKCNGTPIPSFAGEPLRIAMDEEDPNEYAGKLWEALNEDNKVSLFVRAIDLANQAYEDVIINKYQTVEG